MRALRLLTAQHPGAAIELNFANPLELLVAVMLSAQSTDRRVNMVTRELFRLCRTPRAYLELTPRELERRLHPLGFFRQKTRMLRGAMRVLLERFDGRVPRGMSALLELPGVGRKSANVILTNAFGVVAGIAVDTHVRRVARRLGWTLHDNPDRIERDLQQLFPRRVWPRLNHLLVIHGRYVCRARRPDCGHCRAVKLCRFARGMCRHARRERARCK